MRPARAFSRERRAADPGDTELAIGRCGRPAGPPRGAAITCRNAHLVAPRLPDGPTRPAQEVRRRGQRIGDRMDEIAPPILVEIDREAPIGAGQELRLSESSGP